MEQHFSRPSSQLSEFPVSQVRDAVGLLAVPATSRGKTYEGLRVDQLGASGSRCYVILDDETISRALKVEILEESRLEAVSHISVRPTGNPLKVTDSSSSAST